MHWLYLLSGNQIGSPPGSDKMNGGLHNAEDSLPSIGFHMRRFAARNSALEEFPIEVCRYLLKRNSYGFFSISDRKYVLNRKINRVFTNFMYHPGSKT